MPRRLLLIALVALFPFLSAFAADSRTLTGVVTHVTDGDTLWVRSQGSDSGVQVRLQGLDAPEICQPYGTHARDALAAHVLHKPVTVSIKARDVYQRSVGIVSVNGEDLGAWLVLNGYAWSTHYQRRRGPYARQEAEASDARRGLWSSPSPIEPRTFRKHHGSCLGLQTP